MKNAHVDHSHPVRPNLARARFTAGRICSEPPFGDIFEEKLFSFFICLEVSKYVLNQYNGRIDDDAEVDGPEGQKVGVFAPKRHNDDAEEERTGMFMLTIRALCLSPRKVQSGLQEDQQKSQDDVVQDRARGDRDEPGTVVEWEIYPYSRRQRAVAVDLFRDPPPLRGPGRLWSAAPGS